MMKQLRDSGITYEEIGRRAGISKQRAYNIINRNEKINKQGYKTNIKIDIEAIKKKMDYLQKIKPDFSGKINITKLTGIKSGSRERIRELVRIRDNWTCQSCGTKWIIGQRRLDVHHLDEDSEKTRKCDKIEDMYNMITLCHRCHLNIPGHKEKMAKKSVRKQ